MPAEPQAAWAEAFIAATASIPAIAKTKTAKIPTKSGGEYSYTYADLGDIIDVVKPELKKHDLVVVQSALTIDNMIGVETRIYHKAGHVEIFGPLTLPRGNSAQDAGSAVTYARRYALTAALGINTEDDDDGARAVKPEPKPVEPELTPKEKLAKQINRVKADLYAANDEDKELAGAAWGTALDENEYSDDADITSKTKLNKVIAQLVAAGELDADYGRV